MNEKLDSLRKNALLELSAWGGLGPMPGTSGVIITTDKKLYYYHNYFMVPKSLEEKVSKEGITDGEEIPEELYQEIISYINNIKDKEYGVVRMYDAGYNIKGKDFNIVNQYEIYHELSELIRGGMKNEK